MPAFLFVMCCGRRGTDCPLEVVPGGEPSSRLGKRLPACGVIDALSAVLLAGNSGPRRIRPARPRARAARSISAISSAGADQVRIRRVCGGMSGSGSQARLRSARGARGAPCCSPAAAPPSPAMLCGAVNHPPTAQRLDLIWRCQTAGELWDQDETSRSGAPRRGAASGSARGWRDQPRPTAEQGLDAGADDPQTERSKTGRQSRGNNRQSMTGEHPERSRAHAAIFAALRHAGANPPTPRAQPGRCCEPN